MVSIEINNTDSNIAAVGWVLLAVMLETVSAVGCVVNCGVGVGVAVAGGGGYAALVGVVVGVAVAGGG